MLKPSRQEVKGAIEVARSLGEISFVLSAERYLRKLDGVVFIETICGEEHSINPTQKVKEIRLLGKTIYPITASSLDKPKTYDEVKALLDKALGGDWYQTGWDSMPGKHSWRDAPFNLTPWLKVATPWAFFKGVMNTGNRVCGYWVDFSRWKEKTETQKKKLIAVYRDA